MFKYIELKLFNKYLISTAATSQFNNKINKPVKQKVTEKMLLI